MVDRALTQLGNVDITAILENYSQAKSPGSPAFSIFVDALRSTGIFNDLQQPSKKYTLFIPTNDALSRYQDIFSSQDVNKKKQLIYRHMCIDQNLQSTYLSGADPATYPATSSPAYTNMAYAPTANGNSQLICRNALGQDLTLTKDSCKLIFLFFA